MVSGGGSRGALHKKSPNRPRTQQNERLYSPPRRGGEPARRAARRQGVSSATFCAKPLRGDFGNQQTISYRSTTTLAAGTTSRVKLPSAATVACSRTSPTKRSYVRVDVLRNVAVPTLIS